MLKKSKSGGYRPGSGRPKGTGKYREPTEPLRVPRSLLPQVKDLLAYYLETAENGSIEDAEFANSMHPQPMQMAGSTNAMARTNIVKPFPVSKRQKASVYGQQTTFTSFRNEPNSAQSANHSVFPLYATRVAAGFPSPADDHIETKLDLNEHLVKHPAATFFVRVEGESMLGAGIYPNDILVVDRSLKPTNGKVIIAVVNGELTVKRLKIGKGTLSLLAENVNYPSIQITEEMSFSIWGVVTNVIHAV